MSEVSEDPQLEFAYDRNPDHHKRESIEEWVMPNRKGFSNFINNHFTDATKNLEIATIESDREKLGESWKQENYRPNDSMYLRYKMHRQQLFVSQFIQDASPYRGLLLYHGLGSGKTAASLCMAEGTTKPYVIMLPASIHGNYQRELDTFAHFHNGTKLTSHWVWYIISSEDSGEDNPLSSDFLEKISRCVAEKLNKKVVTKGVWLVDPTNRDANYESLDPLQKKEIDMTMKCLIEYKYHFIHYNAGSGLLTALFPNSTTLSI